MRAGGHLFAVAFAAVTAAGQTPAQYVKTFNTQLLAIAGDPAKEAPAQAAAGSVRELAAERAGAFAKLIETDAKRALDLALPEPTLATLRAMAPEVEPLLERYGSWAGRAEIAFEDDPGFQSGRRVVSIQGDISLDVYFAAGEPRGLASGAALSVDGVRLGNRVAAARAAVFGTMDALSCSPTGEQRIAIIYVTFRGRSVPDVTAAQLHDYFFSASDISVDGFWRESSYGKTWATGDVFGPFELPQAYTCSQTNELRSAAIAAADSIADFTRYNRVFIFFPVPEEGCSWSGRGTVGCTTLNSPGDGGFPASTTWISTPSTLSRRNGVFLGVHEGGHNFGLGHAQSRDYSAVAIGAPGESGAFDEYGDIYSAMGNGLAHYAMPHKLRIGWISQDEVATIDDAGSQRIVPAESQDGGIKAVRVRRAAGLDDWIWFEYHQPLGRYTATWGPVLKQNGFGGAIAHYEDVQMRPGGAHSLDTALIDFTPLSGVSQFDFYDAPLAASSVWIDPFTSRSIRLGPAEAGGITIEAFNETACLTLSGPGRDHGPGEESGTIDISAPSDCRWTASVSHPWVTLLSPASGAGSATLSYTVAANPDPVPRTGTINVGRKAFTLTQAAQQLGPSLLSVSPDTGSGPVARLQFTYFDPNGPDDLKTVGFNVTSGTGLARGCAVEYDVAARTVRLADDSGGNWPAPEPVESAWRLKNSQCAIQFMSAGRGWGPEGENLSISAGLQFLAAAAERRDILLSASDREGHIVDYVKRGVWSVEPNVAPAPAGVSPNTGGGMRQVFSVKVKDANGAADISLVEVRFKRDDTVVCGVYIYPTNRRVGLDTGSGPVYASFGSSSPLAAERCTVDTPSVAAYSTGDELTVRLPLLFADATGGRVTVTVSAGDLSNALSQEQQVGEWIIGPPLAAEPVMNLDGVVNAASFRGGAVAPGEIVTVFGTGMGPAQLVLSWYQDGWLQSSVGGTEVFINNVRAPLVHAGANQVSAIVPYSVRGTAKLRVEYQGRQSNEITLPVAPAAPGVFTYAGGQGQAVVVNQDNTLNSSINSAPRGTIITLFVTGEGALRTYWPDGRLPGGPDYPAPLSAPVVTFGGVSGTIDFAGLVWAGVLQINVRVPADAPVGAAVPLTITVADIRSADGVTVAVK